MPHDTSTKRSDCEIIQGDCLDVLRSLDDESVQCCVTSPPYFGLRDYGVGGQIGLEATPQAFVAKMVEVFAEVRRVLRNDGTLWLNLGDSYAGSWGNYHPNSPPSKHGQRKKDSERFERPGYASQEFLPPTSNPKTLGLKPKDLCGMPWRVAFALQESGWWLRQDIIWSKPNPMPESVTDRCTKAHEYIFLLTKSARYFYDADAIREPIADASIARLSQDVANQRGSDRAHAGEKSNGTMKAVPTRGMRRTDLEGYGLTRGTSNPSCVNEAGANKRSVWTVTTAPFPEAHFATFPPKLIEPCILAGSCEGDLVLDPFSGAATTGLVALRHRRRYLGIELNPEYIEMSRRRLASVQVQLF